MPEISVVVPIYKVENYLAECITSILNQTFPDFELILVDDGSPDSCGDICDEYKTKDKRIKVFHNQNGGVSYARAFGVRQASAHWISFVDPDDTLPLTSLETLRKGIESDKFDLIVGFWTKTIENDRVMPLDQYRHATVLGRDPLPTSCVWGKLYRRELLNDYALGITRYFVRGQDKLMNMRIVFNNLSTDVKFVSTPVYNYRIHQASRIQTFKTTIEYESAFYDMMLEAMAKYDKDIYMPELILARMDVVRAIYRNVKNNSWKQTGFGKNLLSDIKMNKSVLEVRDRIICSHNAWIYLLVRRLYENIHHKQKDGFLK